MDIKDRLKLARDIQDKCLIHKIDCEVKTTFTALGQVDDDSMIPYVSIWIYSKDRTKTSFSLYLWNDIENPKEWDMYKGFLLLLEELIKECD